MAGFVGNVYLFAAGWQGGQQALVFVGAITSVIALYLFKRAASVYTVIRNTGIQKEPRMTINIELTPDQEARLMAAANAQGVAAETLVRQFVIERLPEAANGPTAAPSVLEAPGIASRDPELVARVRSIRGKYAHLGVSVEDLHQERQTDQQRELQQLQGENS